MSSIKEKLNLLIREYTSDKEQLIRAVFSVALMYFWYQSLMIQIWNTAWNYYDLGRYMIIVSLFGIWLLVKNFRKKVNILYLCLAFFSIWVLFSTFMNTRNDYTMIYGTSGVGNWANFEYLINYVFLPSVGAILIAKLCNRNLFADLYKIFMTGCGICGLYEYTTRIQLFTDIIYNQGAYENAGFATEGAYRLTLFFYHPIYYCALLGFAFIILLNRPFKNKIVNYLSIVVVLINMLLTQSRSGWIGAGFAFIIFFIKEKKYKAIIENKKKTSTVLLVSLFLFVVAYGYMGKDINDAIILTTARIQSAVDLSGGSIRIENLKLWGYALELSHPLQMKLFGGGYNFAYSFLQYHPTFGYWYDAIDNMYLTILLNYGYVGLGLHLLMYGLIIYKYFKTNSNTNRMICLCLISFAVISYFFESLGMANNITFTFFVLFGLLESDSSKGLITI